MSVTSLILSHVAVYIALLITASVTVWAVMFPPRTLPELDDSIDQIINDWGTPTYTSMAVRNFSCDFYNETSVYTYTWLGTQGGCLVDGKQVVEYEEYVRAKLPIEKCQVIEPIREFDVTEFYGKYICGKQNGLALVDALRPDPDTFECPQGSFSCSGYNTANSICAQSYDDCSVTWTAVIPYADKELYSDPSYVVEDIDKDYVFLWSKNLTDTMPITQTRVSTSQPCLNSKTYELKMLEFLYPLEYQQYSNCSPVYSTRLKKDFQYNEVGLRISELMLQNDSGILDALKALPLYAQYVPDAEDEKAQTYLNLYNRYTINWDIDCELSLMQALEVMLLIKEDPQ